MVTELQNKKNTQQWDGGRNYICNHDVIDP